MTRKANSFSTDKIAELVEFIATMRGEADRTFWFLGKHNPEDEGDYVLLSESMRGEFHQSVWQPLDVERTPCCDSVDTSKDPFALMVHCTSKEHIANLLIRMTDEEIQREYDYMLEHVFDSLTDDWEDMV